MPDKVEHLGEDKFVRAYADEGVSFRNFCQALKLLDTLSSKLMNTFVSVSPLRGEG